MSTNRTVKVRAIGTQSASTDSKKVSSKNDTSKKSSSKKSFNGWGKTIIAGAALVILAVVLIFSSTAGESNDNMLSYALNGQEKVEQASKEFQDKYDTFLNEAIDNFIPDDVPADINTPQAYSDYLREQMNSEFDNAVQMNDYRAEYNRLVGQLPYLKAIDDPSVPEVEARIAELEVILGI